MVKNDAEGNAEYDLVIVGGGLIGASLLLALKDCNLRIALIEAKALYPLTREEPAGSANFLDQRSLVLNLGSKLYYEQLGIWDSIAEFTTKINKIIVSEQGKFSKIFLDSTSFAVPALGYVINIELLNNIIWENLNNLNNMEVYNNCRVINIIDRSDNSHNSDAVSIVLDNNQIIQTIKSKFVIAADGAQSFVRNLLNIETDCHDYQQYALIANVTHELENKGIAYERFSLQGPFALLPRANKDGSQFFSGIVWPWDINKLDYIKNLSDQELLSKLQKLFGYKLGKFLSIGQRQFFPLKRVTSKELFKNRVIFLGNAANSIHPIGGQGFNLGLRDVKYFCDLLKNNLHNLSNCNFESLFKTYAELRYDDHTRLKNNTHNLLNLFSSDYKITQWGRNLGMTIGNHSYILRSFIADQSMGLQI
ncbi:MAG: FAD-dependent monooxygenase [Gammaproteobacteria bacterium]|nr:FAD-dependent monooxygenase [Gammaproteobacteria bacterium]